MITEAVDESSFEPPTFTPEIESVEGNIGSNQLLVTFRPDVCSGSTGIYSNSNLTDALEVNDFWFFDKGGNNPRTIISVAHIAGNATAVLTMSAPLTAEDVGQDALAARPTTIWDWYSGGYENLATGTLPAQPVSAGPWPVVETELP